MAEITANFYRKLFAASKTNTKSKKEEFNLVRSQLNRCFLKKALDLVKPISKGKVLRALKEAPKGNSPGPDAIPVDIYKHLSNVVCKELISLFNHCLEHAAQIPGGNMATNKV
ncbi:hypothetical protein DSO57_1020064 [Entomophthora muscae]|uniref:Uncharacterized protein n=1 Tax=Entomophthora muscae TaxID=34485 RepID=A0ACC2TR00_9FUNG|nr:hypothetical protein DSO57_1020064 [Entomophthora muscae]